MKYMFTFFCSFLLLLLCSNAAFPQITHWRQLTGFPGGGRTGAFSFAIGDKIYMGGGSSGGAIRNDFWEYDISTGAWTRKADFGGGNRYFAVAFSIGNKGYAGTGAIDEGANTIVKDFWEYNPTTNKWMRKADFGGGKTYQAFGAATVSKGYVGTGLSSKDITSVKRDFWEYNPATNQWKKRASLGFIGRFGATAFAMNGKIYAGTGINNFAQTVKDFYEYNPSTNRWRRKTAYAGTGVYNAVGFSIGGIGYIGTGVDDNGTLHADFWSYNVTANKWSKAPLLPGAARTGATAVSANNSGYVLTGYNGTNLSDFWDLEQIPVVTATATNDNLKVASAPAAFATIFPNPANTQFTINMNKGTGFAPTAIMIYSVQGNLVAKYDLGNCIGNFSKTINVSLLTSGMYQVVVRRGIAQETISLLIVR